MKQFSLHKQFLTAAIGGALALVATQASAALAPNFTYDLDGIAGGTTVVANAVSGGSSDYLTIINPTTFQGGGWVQFDALKLNSATVSGTSYADTGLYALFTLTTVLTSGSMGASNSFYDVTAFDFDLYRDQGAANTFTQGNASTATLATVGNTGTDLHLASGSLIFGDAGLHETFGASINVFTDFALTGTGGSYFIDPVPFYDLALAGFNSTGGNWLFNAATGALSVGSATGIVDFQKVPEPGSLALLGLGLVALAAKRRLLKQAPR